MINSLMPPAQWAQTQFGFADLGDQRRTNRLVKIGQALAANPGGTLPQAFPHWAELKAAYRFFEGGGATFEAILSPHWERTQAACRQPGEYLIIEDTTNLDYTDHHPATEDLGQIGDGSGRGFELHNALAVRVEGWTLEQRPEGVVMGLLGQSCSTPRPKPKGKKEPRYTQARKTQCWAASVEMTGSPPPGAQWIYVADRESDFYEPMEICQRRGVDFIIRAYHDRRLAAGAGHLFETLAQAPVLGQTTVEVRARPGQPARTAMVAVRAVRVDLDGPWRPGGWRAPLPALYAVEVFEVHTPEGIKQPLHWILLTSLPCSTWAQVQRVIGRYTARWWIEEYHKALKSGAGVEDSQLERAYRLESLIAVLSVVAVRLLSTKFLARSRPESFEAAESFGPEMLTLLEKKLGKPKKGWTNAALLIAVARLGGFLARKHDGMPGWQTIWRGWQRLMWMAEGVETLNQT
jgi:Transposase DNA-binding/Transposase Tn5 dimerisation domain